MVAVGLVSPEALHLRRALLAPRSVCGAVPGSGFVAVGGADDYEVFGFELFVVASADGDQIVYIGGSAVAVPLSDVVEFAAVHRGPALEAAPVADCHRQALGGIGEALVAS